MTTFRRLDVTLCVAISIMGCRSYPPPSESDLPGTYVLRNRGMVDSISVKRDASYEHHVWAGQKNVLNERGHWAKGQYPDGDAAILFEQFTLFGPPYNKMSLRPGFWLAPVDKDRDGRIILVVNRDVHLYYLKAVLLGSAKEISSTGISR